MKLAIVLSSPLKNNIPALFREYAGNIKFETIYLSSEPKEKILKKDVDLTLSILDEFDIVCPIGAEPLKYVCGLTGITKYNGIVVNEKYLPILKKAMQDNLNKPNVEGLLFKYLHFYGSYDFVGTSKRWYRNEIRVIRNNKNIKSYKDAQGFRLNDRKLNVVKVDAEVYHYGWVKHPSKQQDKIKNFNKKMGNKDYYPLICINEDVRWD